VRFFNNAQTTLGLDIGSHTVKAVVLRKKDHAQPQLIACGIAEIDRQHTSTTAAVKAAGESCLSHCNPKKYPLVTAVGGNSLIIKEIVFPSTPPKEIESALKWEAGRYIPVPGDSIVLKFQIKGVREDGKNADLLLAAVEKKLLQEHTDLLETLQLCPRIIDAVPLALANCYCSLSPQEADHNEAIIEIGATTSYLMLFRRQGQFFCRDIPFGGDRFTEGIQTYYQEDFLQAEQRKRTGDFEAEAIQPVCEQILHEIRQSLFYYDTKTGNKGFQMLKLSGGGAHVRGLNNYLEKMLSLPIVYFEPLQSVTVGDEVQPDCMHHAKGHLGVAIGLALRN